MVKALKIFLFILAFVIIGEIVYFITFKPKTKPGQTTSTNNSAQSDANKILYQEKGDNQERTVIYQKKDSPYSGIGEFYNTATSPAKLVQIIGIFKGWGQINDTKDKYLLLEDPIYKKSLQKLRVAFGPSDLFDGGANTTSLAVENISTGKTDNLKTQIKDIDLGHLDDLIQKGDAIIALSFIRDNKIVYDSNRIVCVNWIIIRRKGGASSLQL